jgi:LmbE family N-acetylglucosaminyl deacetylase
MVDLAAPNPIDAPGTAEAAWPGWPELAQLPAQDVTAWTSAVIVAAHPDDEVLGAGGIVSVLAAAGARLRLIAVTDGESSHGGHGDTAELAARRAGERGAALAALGAEAVEVVRLGLPDTGLTDREGEIVARLRDLVTGFDVCLAPWEGDVHADHEAVGRAARRLGGPAFFYPVWMWHWARPADSRVPWRQAIRVPLPPAVSERKRAAIRCFASQLEARPSGVGPVLPEAFVAHFTRDYEVLFPVIRP